LGDDTHYLPAKVRQNYDETLQALAVQSPVLAGIGLRALLETVCKDRAAVGSDLFKKLDSLVEQRVLTPASATILHKIRALGNAAAHEVKPHCDRQLPVVISNNKLKDGLCKLDGYGSSIHANENQYATFAQKDGGVHPIIPADSLSSDAGLTLNTPAYPEYEFHKSCTNRRDYRCWLQLLATTRSGQKHGKCVDKAIDSFRGIAASQGAKFFGRLGLRRRKLST